MKIKDFYELVEQQREPEATLLPNLQYRTKKYPFFQPDIFIYIKCLYLSNSESFADELTRLAPFVSDRKALFYYVMNDRYKQFQKKAEKRLAPNRMDALINAFFQTMNEPDSTAEYESLITGPAIASSDYFSYLESLGKETAVSEEKKEDTFTSQTKRSLTDDLLETEYTFEYDLSFGDKTAVVPVEDDSEELEPGEDIPPLKHQDIIDQFLAKAADEDTFRIKLEPVEENPKKEEEFDELELEDTGDELENDYFFTQTLANIFIKQKKYERAYEIIKHLSLNYPKKNIYFADQLAFLEKLIKNTNKNK